MKGKRGFIAAFIAIVFTIIFYLARLGGDNFILYSDVLAVIFSFSAVIFGILAVKAYSSKSLIGSSILMMLIGIFLWFLAELTWLIFGSHAFLLLEAMRIGGYLPITVGFFFALMVAESGIRDKKKKLIPIVFVFFIFALIYMTAVPILFNTSSIFDTIITNGYVVADFTLVFGAGIMLLISYRCGGGKLIISWFIISIAFILLVIFNIYFALNYDNYAFGDPIEILWLINYILLSLGFYYKAKILRDLKNKMKKRSA